MGKKLKMYKAKGITLSESKAAARNQAGVRLEDAIRALSPKALNEDIIKDLKENPRKAKEAKEEARAAAIKGFNPYSLLLNAHKKAKEAVFKFLGSEFKKMKSESNKFTVSLNCIVNEGKQFVPPPDGVFVLGVHLYMPAKKGFFGRLFTGHVGKWFAGDLGVASLREYIKTFMGDKVYANQVTDKTVFNAVASKNNQGKVSYFCCFKTPELNDEDD